MNDNLNMVSGTDAVLVMTDVHKTYPGAEGGDPVSVLRGVSLTVHAGDTLSVIGPSGSGKSTLLNLAGALDVPTTGSVRLMDSDPEKLSDDDLAALRRRGVGFVFQLHHLLPQCTALENVLAPTLAKKNTRSKRENDLERALDLLKDVGLGDRSHHLPAQLSGGERQRVAAVRALINRPRLLLADEPTGSLDHQAAGDIVDLLAGLSRDAGVALVMVTHAEDLATRMARRFFLIDGILSEM